MQYIFPFAASPQQIVEIADKTMYVTSTKNNYKRRRVYRSIKWNIWVVAEYNLIYGPSGRAGACALYFYPVLFFKGTEAWKFANSPTMMTPFWDQTLQ